MAGSLSGVQVVLLDIEGTVCPISFVKEVLIDGTQKKDNTVGDEEFLQKILSNFWFFHFARGSRYPRRHPVIRHSFSALRRSRGSLEEGRCLFYITSQDIAAYPYALQALPSVLAAQWDSPSFLPYRDAFPAEHRTSPSALSSHFQDLVSRDVKISYLKSLQGYLWIQGYESGEIRCPLFPDVHPAFLAWHKAGIPIVIYSSGSVDAQKLLFQYTNSKPDEDLRGMISGYFDTVNAGMKMEKSSYEKIAASRKEEIGKWLFLSDRVEEVEAAKAAGMQSLVVVREGNAPLSEEDKETHQSVTTFEGIRPRGGKISAPVGQEKRKREKKGHDGPSRKSRRLAKQLPVV